jgi:hypothetical protein
VVVSSSDLWAWFAVLPFKSVDMVPQRVIRTRELAVCGFSSSGLLGCSAVLPSTSIWDFCGLSIIAERDGFLWGAEDDMRRRKHT